ncbi:MAG: dethiobiotin synthase [Parvibaculales bacterium]
MSQPLYHKQVFIAATGTDIGKTYVTACLIRSLIKAGLDARALKPVISGFDANDIANSDTGQLLMAMQRPCTMAEAEKISPFRFSAALSPDMAAKRENQEIDMDALVTFCQQDAQQSTGDITFIEGVGGAMVPLNQTQLTLDWQARLNIPCLLVMGSYLGTLSHALTCLEALDKTGIKPLAIIINESPESPVPLEETAATLARFCGDIPISLLARNADAAPDALLTALQSGQ